MNKRSMTDSIFPTAIIAILVMVVIGFFYQIAGESLQTGTAVSFSGSEWFEIRSNQPVQAKLLLCGEPFVLAGPGLEIVATPVEGGGCYAVDPIVFLASRGYTYYLLMKQSMPLYQIYGIDTPLSEGMWVTRSASGVVPEVHLSAAGQVSVRHDRSSRTIFGAFGLLLFVALMAVVAICLIEKRG